MEISLGKIIREGKIKNFQKPLDFIALTCYNDRTMKYHSNAFEQEQVSFEGTWRELPVGARQWGDLGRIHPASSAPNIKSRLQRAFPSQNKGVD